jgi:hypothetical protein
MFTIYCGRSALLQVERLSLWVLCGVMTLGGCGSPPEAKPATGAHDTTSTIGEDTYTPLSDGDPLAEQSPSKHEPDPMDRCEGGQCFQCGETICPEGFYCDSKNTCAWLPQCTGTRLSCECLQSQLKGCTCDDAGGHLAVACPE